MRAFSLHQWLGAVVCLYMALIMATGTLSVFDREIDFVRSSQIGAPVGAVGSFGQAFDAIGAVLPEGRVLRIADAPAYWAALAEAGGGRTHVFVTKDGGQVSTLRQSISVQRIVRDLHANLMVAHPVGRLAVTIFGVVLLWQIASGLWAYRRFWRGFARWPRPAAAGQAWWGAVHRLAGLWSLPVLLIAALTSVVFLAEVFGFHPTEEKVAPQAREARLPDGFDGAAVEAAITAAGAALPGFVAQDVALPGTRKAAIAVEGTTGALLAKSEVTKVMIDPETGRVLAQRAAQDMGPWGRVYAAAVPLHYGDFGGLLSKTIWAIGGALGTILALSGAKVAAQRGGMGTIWRGVPIVGRLGLIGALLLAIGMYVLRYT